MSVTDYEIALRLLVACVLGGLIGLERENWDRPAGFRTHILVCTGSTLVMVSDPASDDFKTEASYQKLIWGDVKGFCIRFHLFVFIASVVYVFLLSCDFAGLLKHIVVITVKKIIEEIVV